MTGFLSLLRSFFLLGAGIVLPYCHPYGIDWTIGRLDDWTIQRFIIYLSIGL
jgi:hypothetical protein